MDQQAAPATGQQAYSPGGGGGGGGSVGPVIGVLAVITVLAVAAVVVGRLCTGRRIWGYGRRFDFEGWLERKCAACIDGRIDAPPPPPPQPGTNGAGSTAVAVAVEPAEQPPEAKRPAGEPPSGSAS